MYNPCFECFNRYNRQYSEWCDTNCVYGKTTKELKWFKLYMISPGLFDLYYKMGKTPWGKKK